MFLYAGLDYPEARSWSVSSPRHSVCTCPCLVEGPCARVSRPGSMQTRREVLDELAGGGGGEASGVGGGGMGGCEV